MVFQDAFAPLADVFGGCEPGETPKVMDEVGLVNVTALRCDVRPVWRRVLPHQRKRPLETPHPAEQLGRYSDFLFEDLDESALAEANFFCYLTNARVGFD